MNHCPFRCVYYCGGVTTTEVVPPPPSEMAVVLPPASEMAAAALILCNTPSACDPSPGTPSISARGWAAGWAVLPTSPMLSVSHPPLMVPHLGFPSPRGTNYGLVPNSPCTLLLLLLC